MSDLPKRVKLGSHELPGKLKSGGNLETYRRRGTKLSNH